MQDKLYDKVKLLKDSLNGIETQVDAILKKVTPSEFEYYDLLFRFGIDLIAIFILIRIIYYSKHKNKDYLFTFFLFNLLIFLICALLSTTKIKIGFAFGLFAIFSILRYRTVTVPVKEMGYFFTCVTLGLINSMASSDDHFLVIALCNILVLAMTFILDSNVRLKHENFKEIIYERIDLIQPEKREEMLDDLKRRTGLPIHRIEIRNINFLRDIANIYAYYYANENENRTDPKVNNRE